MTFVHHEAAIAHRAKAVAYAKRPSYTSRGQWYTLNRRLEGGRPAAYVRRESVARESFTLPISTAVPSESAAVRPLPQRRLWQERAATTCPYYGVPVASQIRESVTRTTLPCPSAQPPHPRPQNIKRPMDTP